MKSFIFGGDDSAPSTSAINYNNLCGNNIASWNATETARDQVVAHALTLDRLFVEIDTAPGAGKSFTYTVMKNGSATALTVTLSDAETSKQDTTHSVSFSAGDTWSIQASPTGTPDAHTKSWWSVRQDASLLTALSSGTGANVSNSATNYNVVQGVNTWNATENNVYQVMPTAGVIKNLHIKLGTAPTAGKSYAFTVMKNGNATSVTCTVADASTTGSDTSNTATFAAGDTISIRCVPSGTPTATTARVATSFDPDYDGESVLMYGSNVNPSTSAVRYEQPVGGGSMAWQATEGVSQLRMQALTVKAMYIVLTTAPGGSANYNFKARLNEADTSATVTVSAAATTGSITGLSIAVSDNSRLSLQSTPTSTPASTTVKGGLLLYVASRGRAIVIG